jgi:PAS domain S-box-containing protein
MPEDIKLTVSVGAHYAWSEVLLARAHSEGRIDLLTAAWERVLGYDRQQLTGRTLSQLMGCGKAAAALVVAAILDPEDAAPVDVEIHCKDGRRRSLRLHRRIDDYDGRIYIVADERASKRRAANGSRPTAMAESF